MSESRRDFEVVLAFTYASINKSLPDSILIKLFVLLITMEHISPRLSINLDLL